jgi:hypothetical protein
MVRGVQRSVKEIADLKQRLIELVEQEPTSSFRVICRRVGLPVSSAYAWRKEDPVFDAAMNFHAMMGKEFTLDVAESKLMQKIEAGSWRAIRFMLTTLGKERGYTFRAPCKRCAARDRAEAAIQAQAEARRKASREGDPSPVSPEIAKEAYLKLSEAGS